MCYMGQHLVFKEAQEVINRLTGGDINAKQIERLCHYYGQSLEDDLLGNTEVNAYEEVFPEVLEKPHYCKC